METLDVVTSEYLWGMAYGLLVNNTTVSMWFIVQNTSLYLFSCNLLSKGEVWI